MAEEADSLEARLSRIETTLNQMSAGLHFLVAGSPRGGIPIPFALGGTGGSGAGAGAGGAGGGGGGSAGAAGGAGGIVVSLTKVQMDPPPELLRWLDDQNPQLAVELAGSDPIQRAEGWAKFREWLASSAVSMPAGVAAALIASMLPH